MGSYHDRRPTTLDRLSTILALAGGIARSVNNYEVFLPSPHSSSFDVLIDLRVDFELMSGSISIVLELLWVIIKSSWSFVE